MSSASSQFGAKAAPSFVARLGARLNATAMARLVSTFREGHERTFWKVLAILALAATAEMASLLTLLPLVATLLQSADANTADIPIIGGWVAGLGLDRVEIVTLLVAFVLLMTTVRAGLTYMASYAVSCAGAETAARLRRRLERTLQSTAWSRFSSIKTGTFVNLIGGEPDRVFKGYQAFGVLISAATRAVVLFALLLSQSLTITVLGLLLAGVGFLVFRLVAARIRVISRRLSETRGDMTSAFSDLLSTYKAVRAMSVEKPVAVPLRKTIDKVRKLEQRRAHLRAMVAAAWEPLILVSVAIALAVIFGVFNWPAERVAFFGLVSYRMFSIVTQILKAYLKCVDAEAVVENVEKRLSEIEHPQEQDVGRLSVPNWSRVRFDRVSFSHGTQPVLRDLELDIVSPGLTVLFGPSGSGKTTAIDLLARLYTPSSGRILIDDQDLQSIRMSEWRSTIGYVTQEPVLFNTTLRWNLTFGVEDIEDAALNEACQKAGILEFVQSLPDGYETNVGERGTRFSGGQRQRVAIARALLRNPRLLILDEATAALDPETAQDFASAVSQLKRSYAIVAVTHQSYFDPYADVSVDLGKAARRAMQLSSDRLSPDLLETIDET